MILILLHVLVILAANGPATSPASSPTSAPADTSDHEAP